MKVCFKFLGRVFFIAFFRVRQAYGIKSGTEEHILLMDFDEKDGNIKNEVWSNLLQRFPKTNIVLYDTKNGFHAIVFKKFPFRDAIIELVKTPYIDLNHVCIGISRGYWFLETKVPIPPKFGNAGFMRIERGVSE